MEGRVMTGGGGVLMRLHDIVEVVSGHVASGRKDTSVLQLVESDILMRYLLAVTASP